MSPENPARDSEEESENAWQEHRARMRARVYRLKYPTLWEKMQRKIRWLLTPSCWHWPVPTLNWCWRYTLGRWVYSKRKIHDLFPEAATLRYIRAHTTIPVPRPYLSFRLGGIYYLWMERIDAVQLRYDSLSPAEQTRVVEKLHNWTQQLRSLKRSPSTEQICSILGGPVYDPRICDDGLYGPYKDEAQMKLQIRQCSLETAYERLSRKPDLLERFRRGNSIQHNTVFTHGDIAPRNILVSQADSSALVALIDWETAGWYPEHWEYLKAFWGAPDRHREPAWREAIPQFLQRYDKEVAADKLFGIWGLPSPKYVFESEAIQQ